MLKGKSSRVQRDGAELKALTVWWKVSSFSELAKQPRGTSSGFLKPKISSSGTVNPDC